jgi:hypothetical protein
MNPLMLAFLLTAPGGYQVYDRIPRDPANLGRGFRSEDWSQKVLAEAAREAGPEVGFRERVIVIDIPRSARIKAVRPSCGDTTTTRWKLAMISPEAWEPGERSYVLVVPNTVRLDESGLEIELADGTCVVPKPER